MSILQEYCRTNFRYQQDKLLAIAGVASKFEQYGKLGDYLAGLWMTSEMLNICQQLCWCVRKGQIMTRAKVSRAPSWSWAALDGSHVTFRANSINARGILGLSDEVPLIRVCGYDGDIGPSNIGQGSVNGSILVQGQLLPVTKIRVDDKYETSIQIDGRTSAFLYPDYEGLESDKLIALPLILNNNPMGESWQLWSVDALILRSVPGKRGHYARVGMSEWVYQWHTQPEHTIQNSNMITRPTETFDEQCFLAREETTGIHGSQWYSNGKASEEDTTGDMTFATYWQHWKTEYLYKILLV